MKSWIKELILSSTMNDGSLGANSRADALAEEIEDLVRREHGSKY